MNQKDRSAGVSRNEISSSTDQTQEEAPTVDGKLVNCSACENPRSKQIGSACPKCGHILQAPPATVLIAGVVFCIIISITVLVLLKHSDQLDTAIDKLGPEPKWDGSLDNRDN